MEYVRLKLEPHLADFLKFNTQSDSLQNIRINRTTEFGRVIFSLVDKTLHSVERKYSEDDVLIKLPDVRFAHMERKFLSLSKEAEQVVNDFIDARFDATFFNFMTICRNIKLMQKDAIEYFMKAYQLRETSTNFDRLKQKDFRERKKIKNFVLGVVQMSDI